MDMTLALPSVPERNVTFCIETSGKMHHALPSVKRQLLKILDRMATADNGDICKMFNIIEFNSKVTQWADKMVLCKPETVKVAVKWIMELVATSGTNTMDAIMAAFDDNNCEAVYLISHSLPDCNPALVVDNVLPVSTCRPVHCVYISLGDNVNPRVDNFFINLSVKTVGTYHIVHIDDNGRLEKLNSVISDSNKVQRLPAEKACSVTTSLQVDPDLMLRAVPSPVNLCPYTWLKPWIFIRDRQYLDWHHVYCPCMWSRHQLAQREIFCALSSVSLAAGALMVDKKVLVLKDDDGYFYMGTVNSQILSNKFLVAIHTSRQEPYRETVYQETYSCDIISYDDAKRHSLMRGDTVLAPQQPEWQRFCIGIVIDGQELRRGDDINENQGVTVRFPDGVTRDIPLGEAIWIPSNLYERLLLEKVQISRNHTKQLKRINPSGIFSPTNVDCKTISNRLFHPVTYQSRDFTRNNDIPSSNRNGLNRKVTSAVVSDEMNELIPGTHVTQSQLRNKVDQQLREYELGSDIKDDSRKCFNNESKSDNNDNFKNASSADECDNVNDYSHQCIHSEYPQENSEGFKEIQNEDTNTLARHGTNYRVVNESSQISQRSNAKKTVSWKPGYVAYDGREVSNERKKLSLRDFDNEYDSGHGSGSEDYSPQDVEIDSHSNLAFRRYPLSARSNYDKHGGSFRHPYRFAYNSKKVQNCIIYSNHESTDTNDQVIWHRRPNDFIEGNSENPQHNHHIFHRRPLRNLSKYDYDHCKDGSFYHNGGGTFESRSAANTEDPYYQRIISRRPCLFRKEKVKKKEPWRPCYTRRDISSKLKHDVFRESATAPPLELWKTDKGISYVATKPKQDQHDSYMEQLQNRSCNSYERPVSACVSPILHQKRELDEREKKEYFRRCQAEKKLMEGKQKQVDEMNAKKISEFNSFVKREEMALWEAQRAQKDADKRAHVQDVRRSLSAGIRERQQKEQNKVLDKEKHRIEARKNKRETRELNKLEEKRADEYNLFKEQSEKLNSHLDRVHNRQQRLIAEENRQLLDERRKQTAKLKRIQTFINREDRNSYKKELKAKVDKQQSDTYRSQIFF